MFRNAFLAILAIILIVVILTDGLMRHPSKLRGMDVANHSEEESDWWEKEFVTVKANGEVRPAHVNPSTVENDQDVISIIPDRRIISGTQVNRGDIPYQISILFRGDHLCGGSIYNSRTIITAAHCFFRGGKKMGDHVLQNLIFVAGDHDISIYEKLEQGAYAEDVITHPNYEDRSGVNDIAVVKLVRPYVYNKYVQPLPVDYPPVVPEKVKYAWISGWGYTKKRVGNEAHDLAYMPKILRKAWIEVYPRKECLNIYTHIRPSNTLARRIRNGAICAGERTKQGQTQGKDGCQGDSGGPLACINPNKHNKRFLCGIVSTGIGCGVPGLPGIYTRVSDFQDWIIKVAGYADKRTF